MAQMTAEMAQMNFLVLAWLKRADRQSSVVRTALTIVYRAVGAVMEKLTVRMELMKRAVRPSSAQTQSSAAGMANACQAHSCAMMRQTVMTAVMRPLAHLLPATLRPSSATTLFAFLACGPATVTPTALTARTSGPRTVVQRDMPLLPPTAAQPWSSAVAAESASIAAGSVTEEPTASIDQTKLTVLIPPAALMSLNAVMALVSMEAASATINMTAGT